MAIGIFDLHLVRPRKVCRRLPDPGALTSILVKQRLDVRDANPCPRTRKPLIALGKEDGDTTAGDRREHVRIAKINVEPEKAHVVVDAVLDALDAEHRRHASEFHGPNLRRLHPRHGVGGFLRREDRNDLEVRQVRPVGDPAIDQGRIVSLHDLVAARQLRVHPAGDVAQTVRSQPPPVAVPLVHGPGVAVFETLDDHEQHRSPRDPILEAWLTQRAPR